MRLLPSSLLLSVVACGSVSTAPDAQVAPGDAPTADACAPETDAQMCARLSGACERHTAPDSCGVTRTVDCGACGVGLACVVGQCKTPECTSFTYASQALPAFSVAASKDTLAAATWDARTILYIPGAANSCSRVGLTVADEMVAGSGTYTKLDATSRLQAVGITAGEYIHTLTADGLTVIAADIGGTRIVSATRPARGSVEFTLDATTAFDAINATIPTNGTVNVRAPVISADGLELFYAVTGYASAEASKNGIYGAVRPSTTMPFPAGTKLPAPINDAGNEFLTGVSADRLTAFVFNGFAGRAYTRLSTSAGFTNPNAPAAAPVLSGWNHRPLAGCTKLLAQVSAGGCSNEDIHLQTRQ